jgi:hypothetical protein
VTKLKTYAIICIAKSKYSKGEMTMKKIVSLVLVCILMVGVLASCGSNISEAYAKKINDAAKAKESLTYEEVMKALGDEAIDITADIPVVGRAGIIIAVKGVTSQEDLEKLVDEGEEVKGIVITIAAGKATGAKYGEINEDSFKF